VTVRLATASTLIDFSVSGSNASSRLICAVVNNMPDGAFDETERQFVGLLEEGSRSSEIEVRRYAMSGVPRGVRTSTRIAEEYLPLTSIYLDPPDLLIVTGSNPIQMHIEDELYYEDLFELLTWARSHVKSTLLSCLSAHAALTIYDGITRVRLPTKCTGVFSQDVDVAHPLTLGLGPKIELPHSRWNSVPQEALEIAGFDVVVASEMTGWSVATRQEERHLLVLVQGHPEYEPSSLLREYRRDAGRYVRHERDDLPYLPYHCTSPEDWKLLVRTHNEIINGSRDPHLIDQFPFDDVASRAPWSWRTMATRIYSNWLGGFIA
jgi:homoserine O-succinyltransferase